MDFGGGNQSSNGGLLLPSAERKLGVCGRLADAMPDRRDASRIRHAMFEMVMARVCAMACGHDDAIDLDRLQHDPLMKVAVRRCPQSGAPLASQSTISRHGGRVFLSLVHRLRVSWPGWQVRRIEEHSPALILQY
jgi:hypothetical protein